MKYYRVVDNEQIELTPEEVVEFLAQVPPEPDPQPYRLYKSTFIRRMTDIEASTMETVLAAAPAKLRLLFNSVEYFVSDDELFSDLRDAVGSSLSEQRANELLAPEG